MTKGERIKELRLRSGLTQEELGERIGAIKQTINKYENGTITNIPTDKIEVMASIFGVSAAYIMGWEKPEKEITTIAAHSTQDLTPDEIEEIENYIKFLKSKRK